MKSLLNKKIIIAIFLFLFSIYLYANRNVKIFPKGENLKRDINVEQISSPFKELTIPYLRNRQYNSKLGGLSLNSENVEYKSYITSYSSDGLRINGLLTIPNNNKPKNGFPAIVFVHGYIPPQQYETTKNYVDYVDYFARNNYVVFKIDLRGHGNSDGEASGAYYSSDYVIDILNAYSALQNSNFVDKNKIGLWGHSMAGNLVLRVLASKPTIPAVVIWAGAVYTYEDFSKYGIQDNSYHAPNSSQQRQRKRQELFDKYGQFNKNSEFWRQVVATNYLKDVKGAIQLNHAQDDNVVNIGYSRDLNKILDKININHEFNEYSGGGHNISGLNFDKAMQNSVRFFDKYLK